MRFFKAAAWVMFGVSTCVAAQTAEQNTEQLKEQLKQQAKNVQAGQQGSNPLDLPEDVKEKMRQAMEGKGEYNIPTGNDGLSHLSDEDRDFYQSRMEDVQKNMDKLREKGLLKPFEKETVDSKTKKYEDVAQQIGDHSVSQLERALQDHVGVSEQDASAFAGSSAPESRQNEPVEYAMFLSFSMSKESIRKAILTAKENGAEVYFNGLHPSHRRIDQTMALMREIGKGIENPPIVRFNPTAFEKYSVSKAPTILYREDKRHLLASGITSLSWLKSEFAHHEQSENYGELGPTTEVVEKNLIEELKERMANVDWKAERKKTLDSFWERQTYTRLPRAEKTESWVIDPTIEAVKDVRTPRGELVVKAGTVMNPLVNQSVGLTLVVFNAGDIKQLEWVSKKLKTLDVSGTLMLMTSEINKEKGWKHIEALYEHFAMPVYKLPETMVNRFQISALPAVVRTDLEKAVLKVKQFSINEEKS